MLEIKNLTKKYNNTNTSILAVENLDFTVQDSDFISIIGPSGCGKSTVLRLISGLVEKDNGSIFIDGKETVGPNREKGMVFQNFWKRLFTLMGKNLFF